MTEKYETAFFVPKTPVEKVVLYASNIQENIIHNLDSTNQQRSEAIKNLMNQIDSIETGDIKTIQEWKWVIGRALQYRIDLSCQYNLPTSAAPRRDIDDFQGVIRNEIRPWNEYMAEFQDSTE